MNETFEFCSTSRKLRCRRNTIHVNLFLSFILRALLALSKDSMLKEGLAFAADLYITGDGKVEFVEDKSVRYFSL